MKDSSEEYYEPADAAGTASGFAWHVSDYAEFFGAEIELLAADPSLGPDDEP